VPIEQVEFLAGNPLDHPEEQVEQLKAALQRWGQVENLVVNRRTAPPTVIGGNGRLRAMLQLNWTHVSVCYVDLGEQEANALTIALNRIREGAVWNTDALKSLMEPIDIPDLDPHLSDMLASLAKETAPRIATAPSSTPRGSSRTMISCPQCGHEFEQ